MSFEGKYRLLEPIPDLGRNPELEILGREISSGQPIVIHFLAGRQSAENQTLLLRARSLPPDHGSFVLETGVFQETPYIVTKVLPDNLPVRRWLAKVSAQAPGDTRLDELQSPGKFTAPGKRPEAPHPPSKASTPEPGEFTRMFQAAAEVRPANPEPPPVVEDIDATMQMPVADLKQSHDAPKPPPPPRTPVPPQPEPATTSEPGEFTRLFRTGLGSEMKTAPPPPPPVPSAPPLSAMPPPASEPGEFTRLFQAAQLKQPAPPNPEPAVASEGTPELLPTQAMHVDPKPASPPAPPPVAQAKVRPKIQPEVPARPTAKGDVKSPAPPPQPPQTIQPGEFTRLLSIAPAAPGDSGATA